MGNRGWKSKAGRWLLVAAVVVAFAVVPLLVGREWADVVVQAEAALGVAGFWAYRSRPRVTLRLRNNNGLYLELANVGNRVAKQVTVSCDPVLPWRSLLATAPRDEFGRDEDFGDMDRDQNYVVMLGGLGEHAASVLEKTSFVVSHESTWGFRRHTSTIRFGGSGGRSSIREEAPTAIGEIAKTAREQREKLDKIGKAIEVVSRRLLPPAEGGDDLDLQACTTCGWDRFTYYVSLSEVTFNCANCETEYENEECECQVMWCEHRPAPRQCVRTP